MKLSEYGSMVTHLAQMEDLIDQLAGLGETFAEYLTVTFFLSSLPDSYGTLITALESRPEEDLKYSGIGEEYNRRKKTNSMVNEGEKEQKAMKTIN